MFGAKQLDEEVIVDMIKDDKEREREKEKNVGCIHMPLSRSQQGVPRRK